MQCTSVVRQPYASTFARSAASAHAGRSGGRVVSVAMDAVLAKLWAVLKWSDRVSVERSLAVGSCVGIAIRVWVYRRTKCWPVTLYAR